MRSAGDSTVKASTTGARRSSDCSSASTYTRPMVSCAGPSVPLAPATAMSRSVSSSDQGLKSSDPTVTVRPSCSLARRSSGPLTRAGTESHDRAHTPSSAASARVAGLNQRLCRRRVSWGWPSRARRGAGMAGQNKKVGWGVAHHRGCRPVARFNAAGYSKVTGAGLASGFQGIQMLIVLRGQSTAPPCGWWRTWCSFWCAPTGAVCQ